MRYVRLVAVCDEYDCEPGLVVKGTVMSDGMMADREGGLIAHDLLEHQNGIAAIGPVWDELEALGGVWQVRGRQGDMLSKYGRANSPAHNTASDIVRMFSQWDGEEQGDCGPGGLSVGKRAHPLYEEDFAEIVEIARSQMPREYTDMGRGDPDEDENGWSPDLHAQVETYLTLARQRMRAGFRKAEKRFGDGFEGWELFRAIKEAVARSRPDFEGQEFLLSYGNGEATCRELWEVGE